jgi:hypothetical protein
MPRALALAVAAVAALVLATTAGAAAPRYILVSGPGVSEPVLLGDWSENLELLTALVTARHADRATIRGLGARPRLRLGLFWGWPENPRPTSPAEANQTGWLYPAVGSNPAVIDLLVSGVRVPRIAPTGVVRILERHGVATLTTTSVEDGPVPCTPSEVRATVRRILAAFNRGDLDALDRSFARDPGFRWYSTAEPGRRRPMVIRARGSLVPDLARRHARGERLHLENIRVNGNTEANPPYGNFTFHLTRRSENLEQTRYQGKGAAYCFRTAPDVVLVWSMAPTHRP